MCSFLFSFLKKLQLTVMLKFLNKLMYFNFWIQYHIFSPIYFFIHNFYLQHEVSICRKTQPFEIKVKHTSESHHSLMETNPSTSSQSESSTAGAPMEMDPGASTSAITEPVKLSNGKSMTIL